MAFGFFDSNETPEQRRKRRAMAELLASRGQAQTASQGAEQGIGSILNALMMRQQPQQQPFQSHSWAQGLY